MATSRAKPSDFTGRERERLAKEHQEELARRANEISMANVAEEERLAREVTDYTTPQPTIIDDVESVGVALNEEWEVIQVMEDLEMVTIGAGNHMDFAVGQKYKVPKVVADHLKEKGYVYGA